MPYIAQILINSIIALKAKYSILTKEPQALWETPNQITKPHILLNDWLNPHTIFPLSFYINENTLIPIDKNKFPFICSFFYVDPRYQLTPPIELSLSSHIKLNSLSSNPPNLLTPKRTITYLETPKNESYFVYWKFIKQNDIDIQRLIVESMLTKTPFFIPHSNIILFPLGISTPLTSPTYKFSNHSNISPLSSKFIKKGYTT